MALNSRNASMLAFISAELTPCPSIGETPAEASRNKNGFGSSIKTFSTASITNSLKVIPRRATISFALRINTSGISIVVLIHKSILLENINVKRWVRKETLLRLSRNQAPIRSTVDHVGVSDGGEGFLGNAGTAAAPAINQNGAPLVLADSIFPDINNGTP